MQENHEKITGVTPQLMLFQNGEVVLKLELNQNISLNANVRNFFREVIKIVR